MDREEKISDFTITITKYFTKLNHGSDNLHEWLLPIHDKFVSVLKEREEAKFIRATNIMIICGYYNDDGELCSESVTHQRHETMNLDIDYKTQSFVRQLNKLNFYFVIIKAYGFVPIRQTIKAAKTQAKLAALFSPNANKKKRSC